ncbi:MAG: tetratricopeptide repeat protein [Alphaproteobacteria bacterium]|nr:tetratricopeptide repeat protein [Alphaproteobacteria bacterium]
MRFPSALIAMFLCGASLSACVTAPEPREAKNDATGAPDTAGRMPVMDLETGVQQAQAQRLAGRYDDAIHTLSQLMLVASDDPRVVGEYGKTLAQKGRAQDAVQFLTRATELQQGDWSLYSALGVAYDQIGDQASAQLAYERALKLKPEDASVLNNYALSRMLAKDPEGARRLIARAEAAGGASDPKIARNIEMIDKLAANLPQPQKAAAEEPPAPMPVAVSSNALPPVAPVQAQQSTGDAKVVMQAVPADPLAGPVKPATHEPVALQKPSVAAVKTDAKPAAAATDAVKAVAVKPAEKPVAKNDAPIDLRPASAKSAKAAGTKQGEKAKAPAKDGIPALRQTASAY